MRVVMPSRATMRRVASMPSMFGIRMSRRRTSGCRSRTSRGPVPVFGLADDLDVGACVEDHPKAAADEGLVVGDRDADHRCSVVIGMSARRDSRHATWAGLKVPPRRVTRSRMPISPLPGSGGAVGRGPVVARTSSFEGIVVADADSDVLGGRMLEAIRQGFLDDSVGRELEHGRKGRRGPSETSSETAETRGADALGQIAI